MFSKIRTTKTAACFLSFVALLCSPLLLATAHAQVAGATLSGTVADQSGGLVPQAAISIRNTATDITRSSTTSTAGFYSVPNLLPGTYEVKASAQGFSSQVQMGVTLTVGEQQVLNFTLQVGQISQTVEVSTEAPTVQLGSSSISAVINSTTVRELPLNGRSWTDLAALQPGVGAITAQADFSVGADRGNRGFGNQITIAGARPEQNNYRLDGVSINDFNNAAPGSVMGGDMGVDAIQEFSVLTSNVSAEYGRTSGGVINAITKSGTNQFHGSAYEFLRNDHLDAANFFENAGGIKKASFKQNQFGIAAGGPIRKDKLFVFGDYEGLRRSKGVPQSITVPSNNARKGILAGGGPPPTSCPANSTLLDPSASVCVDNSVALYLPFWPVSTNIPAGSNGDTASYAFAAQQVINENFFTIRGDDKISEKDSLAGTYLRDFTPYSSPDGLDAVLVSSQTHRQIVTLEETHIFTPTLVNSARFGFSREWELNDKGVGAINPLANQASLAAIPGQFAAHVLGNGLGIDTFGGGVNGNSNFIYAWNSYQGYDDAFWTHGTHSIKFGGGVERQQLNRLSHTDPSGVFTFGSLSDFLTNIPAKFTGEDASTVTPQGLRQTIFGLYVQDDWRFRPNLTLNLGLRWEMSTTINDNHGGIVNLINMQTAPNLIGITDSLPLCGKFIAGSCAPGGPLFGNFTHRNFEPRVGFAWDPFHNGKTAVRGSFGVFDILPLAYQYIASATKQFPFISSGSLKACKAGQPPSTCLMPGDFYTGAFPKISPATGNGGTSKGGNSIEQYPHRSYDMQWNLNIQRELVKDLTLMAGYVGSRGVHEPFRVDDADIVIPTLTPEGRWLFPNPVKSGTQVNDQYGSIGRLTYNGNSYFHALEVAVQKAMSHGVQFQTSFTWGKSMDTGSAAGHGDQFSNSISSLPYYDQRMLRTRSDFDIKRTLVVSATWQVPSPKSLSGPAAWIANGWELGWIFKANDGVPFTATWGTGNDPQGLNNGDDWAFPDVLNTPGCATLTNPRNPNKYIKTECFAVPAAPCPTGTDATSCPFYTGASNGIGCDPAPPMGPKGAPLPVPFPQCFNLRGTAGRNLLTGPGTTNLDFSVFKNQSIKRISETFNVQFRAEFFNILNHANFAIPPIASTHTDIFDSTGTRLDTTAGVITSTTTPGREIQFALKFGW
jgi:hypothetical protein